MQYVMAFGAFLKQSEVEKLMYTQQLSHSYHETGEINF